MLLKLNKIVLALHGNCRMIEKEWINAWQSDTHLNKKQLMFNIVDDYIKKAPMSILDIGCGLAFESEMFQKKYDCNLYLLDGDFESTQDRSRKVNYANVESMAFYSKIPDLKQSWDKRKLRYNFIDANTLDLDDDQKFDLVYSFESCGFHYPIATYKNFLKKHTDENTVFIFDIRRKTSKEQLKECIILDKLYTSKKYDTYSLKFKREENF
jgi:SAM-dependent methyltransferase